jgi:hypothetical protein
LAGYFTVTTSREPVRRAAIDDARSKLCSGRYVDGVWTRNDAGRQDEVRETVVTKASDYITVRVDAAGKRSDGRALSGANPQASGDKRIKQ